jgi:hypothetical protein
MPFPTAAFTAVLYKAPLSVDNDDAGTASSRLSEPLLPRATDDSADQSLSIVTPCLLKRLKTLSLVTGALVAFLSQYFLSLVLWSDAIMTQSSQRVVFFSLAWSLATCAMVFISMLLMVQGVTQSVLHAKGLQNHAQSRDWMDATFQMEAHHIIGSLLTISFIWIVIDVLRVKPSGVIHAQDSNEWRSAMVMLACFVAYVTLYKCLLRYKQGYNHVSNQDETTRENSLIHTYQLIAGTLGLLAGLCSQFFLSFVLWKNQMTEPLLDNVILFSLVWSISTVLVTFCGCLSLRLLTMDHGSSSKDDDDSNDKTFLRMESYYVFFSLIGICMAWILIDIVLDMREQIFPSLLMLSVSLACFAFILQCFPDPRRTSLVEELDAASDTTVNALTSRQKPADIMLV